VTHARARRLLFKDGRVIGVRGRFVDDYGAKYGRFEARARFVVLACGARHTPGLLKRSLVRVRGIGRHLHTHPNAKVVGVFDERIDPWRGAHQAHQIHDFLEQGILIAYAAVPPGILATAMPGFGREHGERMKLYNHMLTAGCLIEDSGEGRVVLGPDLEPWMLFSLSQRDVEIVHRGVALVAEQMFAAGARKVLLPFGGLPEIDSPDDLRRIEERKRVKHDIELMTVHIMGTARMSADARIVVGERRQVLLIPNTAIVRTDKGAQVRLVEGDRIDRFRTAAVRELYSDGFQTVVSPATAAMKAFQAQTAIGKLKAVITPTTPSGCHCSYRRWCGRSDCMVCPARTRDCPTAKSAMSIIS